jgi:two-component system response regulator AlgR
MIKVFIADDEEPARERLKELLGRHRRELPTSVVGEARNGLETLERLAR